MSIIDEYLLRREETRRVRSPNMLYATDLTHPCLRQITFNIEYDYPHPINTLRIFAAGRVLEDHWVDILNEHKSIHIVATQLPAYYYFNIGRTPWEIHGRVDILCQHDRDGLVIHEVKTAKTTHWMKDPKPEHIQQLQFYMGTLGVEKGEIDYLDKTSFLQGDTEIDKSFTVNRDRKIFNETITRAKSIATLLGSPSGLPEPNPKAWGGRICDYCLYEDLCKEKENK